MRLDDFACVSDRTFTTRGPSRCGARATAPKPGLRASAQPGLPPDSRASPDYAHFMPTDGSACSPISGARIGDDSRPHHRFKLIVQQPDSTYDLLGTTEEGQVRQLHGR